MRRLITFVITLLFFTLQAQNNKRGFAIQGIARDSDNNSVRENKSITLTFDLYYLDSSGTPESTLKKDIKVTTDAFGVFSEVLELDSSIESILSQHKHFLKIREGSKLISNEVFKDVPYALSAANGVPTGSIMPFMGKEAPQGWLLCDGSPLPEKPYAKPLKAILGSNTTPDLRGMFLRGTGTSTVNGQEGPAVGATQDSQNKEHVHDKGTLKNEVAGSHIHRFQYDTYKGTAGASSGVEIFSKDSGDGKRAHFTNRSGNHSHRINGNTGTEGGSEARPVNYGVNYIIKL